MSDATVSSPKSPADAPAERGSTTPIELKPRNPGPIWKFFSSVWLAVGLMSWVGIVCAVGTAAGVAEAEVVFFQAKWFVVIILTLMTNITIATLNRSSKPLLDANGEWHFPWRLSQIPFLLVHLGLLTVFSAGIITKVTLVDATLHLAEAPSRHPMVGPHESDEIVTKDRILRITAPLPEGRRDNWVGIPAYIELDSGKVVRGNVQSQTGDGDSGTLTVKERNGPVTVQRSAIKQILAIPYKPIFLKHLAPSEDLQGQSPRIFYVGLLVCVLSVLVAAGLGHFFSDGKAPLIVAFVSVLFFVVLMVERPQYEFPILGDRLKVRYKKYYPHARKRPIPRDRDSGELNPALQLELGLESFWLFQRGQPEGLTVEGAEPMISPVEYGPVHIAYERWPSAALADQVVAQLTQGKTGIIALHPRGKPDAAVFVGDDVRPGEVVEVGGTKITITRVFKSFRVRQVEAKRPAGPDPANPTSQPTSRPGRKEIEPYDDPGAGTRNPVIEYQVAGETRPRYVFAWFPEFNEMMSQGRQRGESPIEVSYTRSRPGPKAGVTFVDFADDPDRLLALIRHESKPLEVRPVALGDDISLDIEATVDGRRESTRLDLELKQRFERFGQAQEVENVTAAMAEDPKVFEDAVYIEVEDKDGNTDGDWLMFGRRIALRAGDQPVIFQYEPQKKKLPFKLKLDKFEIETHPGTSRPSEFRSTVTLTDSDDGVTTTREAKIFMNHTLDYEGYRFFQSSYQIIPGEPKSSIFSVAKDPGTPIAYFGFCILCFGVFVIFFIKPSLVKLEKRRTRLALGLSPWKMPGVPDVPKTGAIKSAEPAAKTAKPAPESKSEPESKPAPESQSEPKSGKGKTGKKSGKKGKKKGRKSRS